MKRGLKMDTISGYLSSIRAAHFCIGFCRPALREDIVTAIINGAKKRDLSEELAPRLAVKPALSRELKDSLKDECIPVYDKRLLWCMAYLAFWGSLQIHEILAVQPQKFTPDRTMCETTSSLRRWNWKGSWWRWSGSRSAP